MPTPTGSGPVSSVSLTGNNYIDSLLYTTKWGGAAGTSASVTYSFPGFGSLWSTDPTIGYGPSTGSGEPWGLLFSPLNSTQQAAAQSALQQWANVAAITFVQSQDNSSVVGDIRFDWTDNNTSGQAYAYFPSPAVPKGGDIWLNVSATGWGNFAPGSYGHHTLSHEVGHAIGLKHPFSSSGSNSTTLSPNDDLIHNTIMSYSEYVGAPEEVSWTFSPTTPMRLDIKAAQYLYGPNNSYRAGDDVYTYFQGQNYFETIWDAGGNDTIVYSGSDHAEIDVRPGNLSNLGNTLFTSDFARSNEYTVVIYDTVIIENATGGNGADLIYGNDVANSLQGSGGDDTIYGFAGNDEVAGGAGNDYLEGGAGNDRFDWDSASRAGADIFVGGLGDDTYVVSGNDQVVEASGEGTDLIWADTNFSIESIANVENLFLFGSNPASATGNALNNNVAGNPANNVLQGAWGDDTLAGAGGADALYGGPGEDTASFVHPISSYTLTRTSWSTETVMGPGQSVWLDGVEKLHFADGNEILQYANGRPLADFDGNGTDDLLFRHLNGSVWEWQMNGATVTASSVLPWQPTLEWMVAGTGDFDGDGAGGILWRNNNTGQVAVWELNGLSIKAGAVLAWQPTRDWTMAGTGDFDGDGKTDLVWRHDNGSVAIWLMNGIAQPKAGAVLPWVPGADWQIAGTGDFDLDGLADVLWRHDSGSVGIWNINGLSIKGSVGLQRASQTDWTIAATADFNRDGRTDILMRHDDGELAIWMVNGSTVNSATLPGAPGQDWTLQGVGDVNADHKTDIVWQHNNGTVALWTMDDFSITADTSVANLSSDWLLS